MKHYEMLMSTTYEGRAEIVWGLGTWSPHTPPKGYHVNLLKDTGTLLQMQEDQIKFGYVRSYRDRK